MWPCLLSLLLRLLFKGEFKYNEIKTFVSLPPLMSLKQLFSSWPHTCSASQVSLVPPGQKWQVMERPEQKEVTSLYRHSLCTSSDSSVTMPDTLCFNKQNQKAMTQLHTSQTACAETSEQILWMNIYHWVFIVWTGSTWHSKLHTDLPKRSLRLFCVLFAKHVISLT